jgi:lipopolysaccharide transport system ATP-binding protein
MDNMANNIAIEVKNLSKIFKIYHRPSDLAWEIIRGKARHREFCALHDVSFEVKRGEVVGFIGRNGAGKSTLLKILAGTLDKTSGEVAVNGTLSAILELGSGFNKEYTGRQNIQMGGLCLGMSRREIEAKTDWIIDFSELADFIDQPFKTYSSGMQARLTFATAAAVDPDILIVDEALSVGDASFQLKSMNHLRDMCNKGITILLVSHDTNAITSLCNRAVLLDKGELIDIGDPTEVTARYLKILYGFETVTHKKDAQEKKENVTSNNKEDEDKASTIYRNINKVKSPNSDKNKKAEIISFEILDDKDININRLFVGERYRFVMRVIFYEDINKPSVGFLIRNRFGVDLFGANSDTLNLYPPSARAGSVYEYRLSVIMNMVNGPYFLTGGISHRNEKGIPTILDILNDYVNFEVSSIPKNYFDCSVVYLNPIFESQEIAKL